MSEKSSVVFALLVSAFLFGVVHETQAGIFDVYIDKMKAAKDEGRAKRDRIANGCDSAEV
jgi:hypothetical protein